ncbi:hypothetical protein HID58_070510 [Brassica napus]|uniref:Jacalin-type lectin domain-containing protein n=1 Tax=Brassica napus TaxID=3708 RepID=A0ABQ7YZ28_BRANA|nr:hypothetical protein HID58_070510 [Brassica napus]
MKSLGGNKGEEFNDVGYESVKKITVGAEDVNITYIKIEYVKNGKVEIREHGAYFSTSDNSNSGRESKSEFSTQKLDAQGGKGGNQWDDGGDHDRVTKVHVAVGRGIEQISFDYLKNRQTNEGPDHGVKGGRSSIRTNVFYLSKYVIVGLLKFFIRPNEYLLSVKGWSDSTNKIVGIKFITNTKTSECYGFEKTPGEEGTDISLEVKDKKIAGFHGFADSQVNSLGAYFAPVAS